MARYRTERIDSVTVSTFAARIPAHERIVSVYPVFVRGTAYPADTKPIILEALIEEVQPVATGSQLVGVR